MGEYLPDGSYQNYYRKCEFCGKEIEVNIQGDERGKHDCINWVSVPCTSPTCRGLKTGKPFPAICKVGFEDKAVCNECFCK